MLAYYSFIFAIVLQIHNPAIHPACPLMFIMCQDTWMLNSNSTHDDAQKKRIQSNCLSRRVWIFFFTEHMKLKLLRAACLDGQSQAPGLNQRISLRTVFQTSDTSIQKLHLHQIYAVMKPNTGPNARLLLISKNRKPHS